MEVFFDQHPVIFLVIAGYLGLTIGSFLNVVIHRLPIMLEHAWKQECRELLEPRAEPTPAEAYNLSIPRSACPACGHKITALENIPVLSYLFLHGKCRKCSTHISLRYPAIELTSGIAALLVAAHYGATLSSVFVYGLIAVLIVLTMIDLAHQLLPDQLTLPLLWAGLLANSLSLFTDLHSAVIGAIAGYATLWIVFQLFKWITGKEGMGYGDFKLFAALGAWMGWQMLPLIILLSSILGIISAVLYLVFSGVRTFPRIPFGPFLSIAGLIAFFWGKTINQTYLSLTGMQ